MDIRGHFGIYGEKKRNFEIIETDEDYIKLIENARSPPFKIVREADCLVQNFETFLQSKIKIPKNLQVSKAVRIQYFQNGQVNIYKKYNDYEKLQTHLIDSSITYDELCETPQADSIGISAGKIKDVRPLLRYLSLNTE